MEESEFVLAVLGLDTIGQTIEESCYCIEEVKELRGVNSKEHRMCEEDLAQIISSVKGLRKSVGDRSYYPILNKCDLPGALVYGENILRELKKIGIQNGYLTCRKEEEDEE